MDSEVAPEGARPPIDTYACPECKTALTRHADELGCVGGQHVYPVVAGVPDLRDGHARLASESLLRDIALWSAGRQGRDPWRRLRARAWTALLVAGRKLAPPPGVFADLGSGKGDLAREAARLGYRTVAVDLDVPSARAGAERARGTLDALPLSSSCVRVAAMSASLHYARDPIRALREARRVLTTDGVLLVVLTPVNESTEAADLAAEHTRRAIRAAGGTGPLATGYRHFVSAELRAAFDRSGFALTERTRVLGIGWEAKRRIQSALTGYECARFPLLIARPRDVPPDPST